MKVLGQTPVNVDGKEVAKTLVIANGKGAMGYDAELTVVTVEPVTVPNELVALIV
jgi:hypothetical protein